MMGIQLQYGDVLHVSCLFLIEQWTGFITRKMLERNLLPSIASFGFSGGFTFMHDNDPKHTSALVKGWPVKQHMKILPWLSYSPDLNPVEYLWDELDRRLKKHQPKNRQELDNLLMKEWNKIEISVLEKPIDSVPIRLYQCIRIKGYPTKYSTDNMLFASL